MSEKLQKIISASGLMSRRAAEKLIEEGRVSVNGAVASLGDRACAEDVILVDGKALPSVEEKTYIMLNKPRGYVTTMSDEKGRACVRELVKDVPARVFPVGRLDMYSEGLLIMTDDGELANRLTHPSNRVVKDYHTWVKGEDIGFAAELLRHSMEIDGYVIAPAEVDILELLPGGAKLSIKIHEGRNRQVRKMCETVGLKVTRLMRVSEGELSLGQLKSGKWRKLTDEEIIMLGK